LEKKEEKIPVLFLQGSYVVELAIARSLGKYDVPVFLLSRGEEKPPSSFSKFVKDTLFNPDPLIDEENFVDSLLNFGERLKKRYGRRILLFPTEDSGLLLMAKNFNLLKTYFVLLNDPEEKEILRFSQKTYFFQTLQETNSTEFLPLTLFCRQEDDIESIKKNITFPCIIKPSEKDLNFSFYRKYNSKILLMKNKDDLEKRLAELLSENHKLVVQELVNPNPGEEVCWWGYRNKSGEIFGITAREIRKFPQMGGTATFMRIEEISEIHHYAKRILESINFWGICEIPFMPDLRTNQFKVLEFNPKCWLQLSLATEVGLNLPYVAYLEVYKNKLWKPIIDKRKKMKWVRAKEDFIRAVIKDKNEGVLKRLFKWMLQVLGGCVYAIHSLSDLEVTLNRIFGLPWRLLKKL
jgi:D-aspartate ligase